MFAYVFYLSDKYTDMVPVGYIRNFESESYNSSKIYRVFWSKELHNLQNKNDKSLKKLKSLRRPPPQSSWGKDDRFYDAHVLRFEESLEALIESLEKKRVVIPAYQEQDVCTPGPTEDEVSDWVMKEKVDKKAEEAAIKKAEQGVKRKRAENILKTALETKKITYETLNCNESEEDDIDSDVDPELIPKSDFDTLKKTYEYLERDNYKKQEEIEELKLQNSTLKHECAQLKEDLKELNELRDLNRQLQGRLLNSHAMPGEYSNAAASDPENTELDLGGGVTINRNVYQSLMDLRHVRKFCKSLAVAIWGSNVLMERSVTGQKSKNVNGPKKLIVGVSPKVAVPPARPQLTPEKLSVISDQMREFLRKHGASASEIEGELKMRNKYISDKIQDLRSTAKKLAFEK